MRAWQLYQGALALDNEKGFDEAMPQYEAARNEYYYLYSFSEFAVEDFNILIDILNKLKETDSVKAFYMIKRVEAAEKAEWKRWLYLKNKYGKEE